MEIECGASAKISGIDENLTSYRGPEKPKNFGSLCEREKRGGKQRGMGREAAGREAAKKNRREDSKNKTTDNRPNILDNTSRQQKEENMQ
jgi:hypothetical protein